MTGPPEVRAAGDLRRFVPAARWVHRATAVLMTTCLLTAAALYVGPISVLVGRRDLVASLHVWAGVALPLPALLGWAGSRAVRLDFRRLGRFGPVDREWLRSSDRRRGRLPVGKFNAGQKLNSSVLTGAVLVLLGTGLLMRYGNAAPLSWRTGATFVHDWSSAGVALLVLGHMSFATRDPQARAGLRTGHVSREWARREHRGWAEQQPE